MATMNRRTALKLAVVQLAGSLAWAGPANRAPARQADDAFVQSVTGRIAAGDLQLTLPHEHVLVDFIGADQVSRSRYDPEVVFKKVLPRLTDTARLGVKTLIECTPAYIGRDPQLLVRLSKESGLNILTNTGYYGASGGKYLPRNAHEESADQLARRWLAEWTNGIEDSGVRPGFMKIGMDGGPLTAVNRKLVEAAAITHRESGLPIASHTGDGQAALGQLEALSAAGIDPSAWIWVHAHLENDFSIHHKVARQGGWVEFDGLGPDTIERHVELVRSMKAEKLLHRVLISHDAGWYWVGEPDGGMFRPFDTLVTKFLPALTAAGVTSAEIDQLTVKNPASAFALRP